MLTEGVDLARILRQATFREMIMPSPNPSSPYGDQPPMPAPVWTPEIPVEEPGPDVLPDDMPLPNPDETRDPPILDPGSDI